MQETSYFISLLELYINAFRKFSILLLSVCFIFVKPQDITINCDFDLSEFDEYACNLNDITVLDPSANVIFGGTHVATKGNDDVEFVHILNSTTPFVIPQLFTTFPNLIDLTITRSGLQAVNIPESARLTWIDLHDNNITRLERDSFRNQTALVYCFLQFNQILEIDENAFAGLENLLFLDFSENLITELSPQTFNPLSSVTYINFMDNLVTRVEAELFSRNSMLGSLNMSFNRINAISPRFGDSFRETAHYIGLVQNVCIDDVFDVETDDGWNDMTNDLQTCFDNFNNGTSPDTRRIVMEFSGPLTISDENGNILARI